VFTYSKEEATRAAKMQNQISERVKQKRRERAMAEQHKVARGVSESFLGRTIRVLVEGQASARALQKANVSSWEHGLIRDRDSSLSQLKGRFLVARGEADAPDIDGRVYVRGQLPMGDFARVRVMAHTDYDLIAEPA
jgi:ribosomal protein S12 methylthiotransferase